MKNKTIQYIKHTLIFIILVCIMATMSACKGVPKEIKSEGVIEETKSDNSKKVVTEETKGDNSKISKSRFIYIDSVYSDIEMFPGDTIGHSYYDRYTKVVYFMTVDYFTPLYNSDGTLLLYDDWLEQEKEK